MGAEVITRLTFEQFRQLPDGGQRYELIRGEVHLTPSPTTKHQVIQLNLARHLSAYVVQRKMGEVYIAPLDVRLTEDTVVQPDLIYVSNARAAIIREEYIDGAPDLAVEILSPSTAAHDRATKLRLYSEAAVPEVWLIDPLAKTVEVFKLQGSLYLVEAALAGGETLTSSLIPGWEMPLAQLFDFRGRF